MNEKILSMKNSVSHHIELARIRRLEGMQGPERHLVEDVAERIPQRGDVEAPQEGRRDVEEIGGAVELRSYIDRQIEEARAFQMDCIEDEDSEQREYFTGKINALFELQKWLADTDSQRSDLFNDTSAGTDASASKA